MILFNMFHRTIAASRRNQMKDRHFSTIYIVVCILTINILLFPVSVSSVHASEKITMPGTELPPVIRSIIEHLINRDINFILAGENLAAEFGRWSDVPDIHVHTENLDKVLVSAEHLLSLVTAILEIAKIEAGRVKIEPTRFDVAPLTESCIATVRPLIAEDTVRLQTDLQPDLPAAYSDPEKLRQILVAVLSNAAKYTSEGEIRVGVRHEQEQSGLH